VCVCVVHAELIRLASAVHETSSARLASFLRPARCRGRRLHGWISASTTHRSQRRSSLCATGPAFVVRVSRTCVRDPHRTLADQGSARAQTVPRPLRARRPQSRSNAKGEQRDAGVTRACSATPAVDWFSHEPAAAAFNSISRAMTVHCPKRSPRDGRHAGRRPTCAVKGGDQAAGRANNPQAASLYEAGGDVRSRSFAKWPEGTRRLSRGAPTGCLPPFISGVIDRRSPARRTRTGVRAGTIGAASARKAMAEAADGVAFGSGPLI
jgi:hypothetical protein